MSAGGGELRRRLVHVAGSGVPVAYLLDRALGVGVVTWSLVRAALVAGTALAFLLELLRLTGRVDWAIFDRLIRDYERGNVAGYALYAVGLTVAALAFAPRVAVPAMLMLTVGDPISGRLGSDGYVKRGWVLLVMFGVCLLVATPFVPPVAAVSGALVATLADGVKPVFRGYVLDDNLTIPIGGGLAMHLVLAVLPQL